MPAFHPGPPYHFYCLKCDHQFIRLIKLGLFFPKCHSLRVRSNWRVLK